MPANPSFSLIVAAVALVYFNSALWHMFLVFMFSIPTVKRRYERFSRSFNRAAGVLVGAFGLKLVLGTLQEYRAKT